mmetsp:Transcript_12707/g.26221  ORF Transcript_12707/g.26221 Transcript_12707/m.26221 type:complete len:253 (-) Transcript_12707:1210-1968(-)
MHRQPLDGQLQLSQLMLQRAQPLGDLRHQGAVLGFGRAAVFPEPQEQERWSRVLLLPDSALRQLQLALGLGHLHFEQEGLRAQLVPGEPSGRHKANNHPKGVDVTLLGCWLSSQQIDRHVSSCPAHDLCLGRLSSCDGPHALRDPKVSQLCNAGANENVLRLDIPVHEAFLVQMRKTVASLVQKLGTARPRLLQRPGRRHPELLDELGEVAITPFQDNAELAGSQHQPVHLHDILVGVVCVVADFFLDLVQS